MNLGLYKQLKALIGELEIKLDMVDREEMTFEQEDELSNKISLMFEGVCRRSKPRGAYEHKYRIKEEAEYDYSGRHRGV